MRSEYLVTEPFEEALTFDGLKTRFYSVAQASLQATFPSFSWVLGAQVCVPMFALKQDFKLYLRTEMF